MADAFARLLNEHLTDRQKLLLKLVAENHRNLTASSFVRVLSSNLDVPKSTLWSNLRSLRRIGLVSFGNGSELRPTVTGRAAISKVVLGKEYWRYGNKF